MKKGVEGSGRFRRTYKRGECPFDGGRERERRREGWESEWRGWNEGENEAGTRLETKTAPSRSALKMSRVRVV